MMRTCSLWFALTGLLFLQPLPGLELDGWNGWVDGNGFSIRTDTDDTENELLDSSGKGGNFLSHRLLPQAVGLADSATFYFTFQLQDTSSADLNVGLSSADTSGLSSSASGSNSDLFGPQLRIVDDDLQIRDGSSFLPGPSNLATGVTYHVWMTAHNRTDTWELRIRGGVYTDTTRISAGGKDAFGFRGSTGANELRTVVLRANNSNAGSNGALLDNLHVHVIRATEAFPDEVLPTASVTAMTDTTLHISWTSFPGDVSYTLEAGHPDGPPFTPVPGGTYDGRTWTGPIPEPGPNGLWFRLVVEESQ